jgi:trimethylamine--corrinoid protein Co-methyltransferase
MEALRALEEAGARVDYAEERVWLPRRLVEEFVDRLKAESGQNDHQPPGKFTPPSLAALGTQVAPLYLDYEKGEKRSGNRQDFITLVKLGNALHPEAGVGHALLLTDVPPMLEPLEAGLILAEFTDKPHPPFGWNVRQWDYLIEMGEILGVPDWVSRGALCFAHPLRLDRDVADRFVRQVKEGHSSGLTSMAVAGATAPVTVEGFVAMASAEHIAVWFAARALNPHVPLGGSMWAGTVDMRTGAVSYSAFDAMFYAFATVEFLRKWTGRRLPVGGGEYCDAKQPGLFAAMEKAYKSMLIAAFTGAHPSIGQGMLEEGKVLSPVQLLLERDLGLGARHLGRGLEINAENLALDTILEIGLGLSSSYLETDHTLRHFRSSLWNPEFIDRSGWNGAEGDRKMLEGIEKRVKELVASSRQPEVDPDKLQKMREVVERARKELLG